MARQPRTHQDYAYYHVMVRGNAGQNIFFTTKDREYFYDLIKEGTIRFNYLVHGFCLMSNHVHLVIQVSEIPISKVMQNICFRYARWINKHTNKVGHVFQGRFKAILVDSDSYLLKLIQYIHLNPVEAKLVACPVEYAWSSHRAYLELEEISWLTKKFVLDFFGLNHGNAIKNFKNYIESDTDDLSDEKDKTKIEVLLGDNAIRHQEKNETEKHIQKYKLKLPDIIEFVCSHYKIDATILRIANKNHNHAIIRASIAWLAKQLCIDTLTGVAKHFNRDVSGIIRILKRIENKPEKMGMLLDMKMRLIKSTSQA